MKPSDDLSVQHYYRIFSNPEQHRQFDRLREEAAKRPHPVVIELGVGSEGISTIMFTTEGAEVWSVDISPVARNWGQHLLIADDVSGQAQEWLPGECDILFIDSLHEYGHCLKELSLYASRVKPGGVILAHDTQFANDRELPEPTGEIARALDRWCSENGKTWVNLPGSYGLGIIEV